MLKSKVDPVIYAFGVGSVGAFDFPGLDSINPIYQHKSPLANILISPSNGFSNNNDTLTKHNSLSTGSLGCAPTPNQYLVLLMSSLISLYLFCLYGT